MNTSTSHLGKPCICCGSNTKFKYTASPLDYCLDKNFEIYKCENCGHGYTNNVDNNDLTRMYEEGAYDPKEKFWHKLLRPAFDIFEIAKVSYLHRSNESGKSLLEVGTGKGNFLSAALKAGYDAYGIEPSIRSYKIAKLKVADKVFNCTLEEMSKHPELNEKFDFIMLWHVLEHLHNPENMIQMLQSNLKPNGILIIGVPNFDSYQSLYGRKNWYHLDPPRHLSHFTPRSVELILRNHGLSVEKTYYNSFFQNYMGDIISLNNLILSHKNVLLNTLRFNRFYFKRTTWLGRMINLLAFFIISSVIFLPCWIFTHLSQLAKKSGTIVIVAKNK